MHDGIPYFYTDQFDLSMELSGYPPLMKDAELLIRGDLDGREFIAFWVDDGRVVGGMNVNVSDVQKPIKALIRSGDRVDAKALVDTDTPAGQPAAMSTLLAVGTATLDQSRATGLHDSLRRRTGRDKPVRISSGRRAPRARRPGGSRPRGRR